MKYEVRTRFRSHEKHVDMNVLVLDRCWMMIRYEPGPESEITVIMPGSDGELDMARWVGAAVIFQLSHTDLRRIKGRKSVRSYEGSSGSLDR